jgi:hypothetical protein
MKDVNFFSRAKKYRRRKDTEEGDLCWQDTLQRKKIGVVGESSPRLVTQVNRVAR